MNLLVGVTLTTVLFCWTYSHPRQPVGGLARPPPGRLLVAVGFEILKVVGSVYLPRAISGSSALYGSIGVVFATLAWLAFYARLSSTAPR